MISIVLALFNGERFLDEQLDSIQAQTFREWELIAVDDGSTDRSLEIIRRRAATDGRIRVYSESGHLGITPNFLRGIALAKGDYVCFSDQDDVWLPNKLAILLGMIQDRPEVALVYSDLTITDEKLHTINASFLGSQRLHFGSGRLGDLAVLRNVIPGCSMLFRKAVADLLARSTADAPFRHDHLAFILAAQTGRIDFTPQTLLYYRQHGQNAVGVKKKTKTPFDPYVYSKDLREKARYLQWTYPQLGINHEKLRSFCDSLEGIRGPIFAPGLVPYFLFLKENTLGGRATGIFQGLLPRASAFLRSRRSVDA